MRMIYMEETEGVMLVNCSKVREYSLPELPSFSIVGYYPETRKV